MNKTEKKPTHVTGVLSLVARLERIAANSIYPPKVRAAAKRDAEGYRAALVKVGAR